MPGIGEEGEAPGEKAARHFEHEDERGDRARDPEPAPESAFLREVASRPRAAGPAARRPPCQRPHSVHDRPDPGPAMAVALGKMLAASSTPSPGRAAGTTTPSTSASPAAGSRAISRWPSRSTQSASGDRCTAAAMPIEDSTMHPSMTRSPCARATWIKASAGRMPPAFMSFTFTPSTTAASAGMSAATTAGSSAMIGMRAALRTRANPARSRTGTGCSRNSTPAASSSGRRRMASSAVQPPLASTRSRFGVASRTRRSRSRSPGSPILTLSTWNAAPAATASGTDATGPIGTV